MTINKTYEKYKDSGFDWIGQIPKHWKIKRLKYIVLKVGSGITPTGGATVYKQEGIPLLRSQNIYSEGIQLDDVVYISEEIDSEMKNSRIQEEDVLLNITGASIGRCSYVPKGFGKGNVNQHVCIIRPIHTEVRTLYLHFMLVSDCGQKQIGISQTGGNREGLNFQQIKLFNVPIPCSLDEQDAIIRFLQDKTQDIDSLISYKTKLISLLQEKRQAIISEAVTKGLDKNVKMKDTGIEWIGKIPETWEVALIKRKTVNITDGAHISPDTQFEDYPFISVIDIKDGIINFENCIRTSSNSYHQMVATGCRPKKGDILLSKDGTIGKTVVVRDEIDFVVASSLVIIKPNHKKVFNEYLAYWLQSERNIFQMNRFVRGAALRRISITNITKMYGVFPSYSEQLEIVKYIEGLTLDIDNLIQYINTQISKLKEYRHSLITEVVTGKIDVRGESYAN